MSHWNGSPFVFSLDAKFQSCTQISIRIFPNRTHPNSFLSHFWLALVGFLDIQSIHIHMQDSDFALPVCLKFQINRHSY